MKKWIIVLLALLFQICVVKAQNSEPNKLDSLVNLAISLSEEALYDARFLEARETVKLSYFRNFKDFKDKHEIALTIQDIRVEGFMNIVYQRMSKPDENFKRLERLLPFVEKIKEKEIQGSFFLAFSRTHRLMENLDAASIYEEMALKIFKEIRRFDRVAEIQANQISRVHTQYLNYDEKEKILELIPKYEDEIKYANKYSKFALAYNTRHLAQIHRRQTFNYGEALRLFKTSLLLREEIGFKPFIPASYSSIGDVYVKISELKPAIEMYLRSAELATEIGFIRYQSYPYLSIGDIYLGQGNKEMATEYYSKALKFASKENYSTGIDSAIDKISKINN